MIKTKIKRLFSSKNTESNINFNVVLPNLKKTNIILKSNSTIFEFENELKKIKNFEFLEIRNWNFSLITKNSTLFDILYYSKNPIFLKVDRMEWQEIYNNKLKDNILLEEINRNKLLSDFEIHEIKRKIRKFKYSYSNSIKEKVLFDENNISRIFDNLYDLKYEYNIMNKKLEKIEKNCQIKALLLILFSGSLFIIELFCLYYGTFILYSWDIIEPMTYIMTCFNFLLLIIAKRKFAKFSPHEYLKNYFFQKKIKSSNFNMESYNQMKRNILLIENKLNI